jgi:hypothetical protein
MWDKTKLGGRTFKLVVCGDDFLVRKIKVGELLGDTKEDAKEDAKKKSCNLISKVLLDPALTPDEVNGLDYDIYTDLQSQIMDLNGMSVKSKEAIQGNLKETPPDKSSLKLQDGSENTPAK